MKRINNAVCLVPLAAPPSPSRLIACWFPAIQRWTSVVSEVSNNNDQYVAVLMIRTQKKRAINWRTVRDRDLAAVHHHHVMIHCPAGVCFVTAGCLIVYDILKYYRNNCNNQANKLCPFWCNSLSKLPLRTETCNFVCGKWWFCFPSARYKRT